MARKIITNPKTGKKGFWVTTGNKKFFITTDRVRTKEEQKARSNIKKVVGALTLAGTAFLSLFLLRKQINKPSAKVVTSIVDQLKQKGRASEIHLSRINQNIPYDFVRGIDLVKCNKYGWRDVKSQLGLTKLGRGRSGAAFYHPDSKAILFYSSKYVPHEIGRITQQRIAKDYTSKNLTNYVAAQYKESLIQYKKVRNEIMRISLEKGVTPNSEAMKYLINRDELYADAFTHLYKGANRFENSYYLDIPSWKTFEESAHKTFKNYAEMLNQLNKK